MKFYSYNEYQKLNDAIYIQIKEKINSLIIDCEIEHIGASSVPGAISKGDLDVFVGVKPDNFEKSLVQLQQLGFVIKEDTFRSNQLCMLESHNYDIPIGIQLVDMESDFTMFLAFKKLLISDSIVLDSYNLLKKNSEVLSEAEYRSKKSEFIRKELLGKALSNLSCLEKEYWESYSTALEHPPIFPQVTASIAGNEDIADELLNLYLDGKKSAGSGLVKEYEKANEELPKVGSYWIVLDSKSKPKCILKTVRVEISIFEQISKEIAEAEGEGDLSVEYWQNAHEKFFKPFLNQLGIEELSKEKVVTEFFELVFKQ